MIEAVGSRGECFSVQRLEHVCCICLTEVTVHMCAAGHGTCSQCLEQHVRLTCDLEDPSAQQELLKTDGTAIVRCPFAEIHGRTSSPCLERFSFAQLATLLSPTVLEDTVARTLMWIAKRDGQISAAEEIAKQSQEAELKKRVARFAQQKMLRQALPDAYQCGRCGHGPVLHANCSNLRTHHGELRTGVAARTSNACAKCGWFVSDIKAWPRWDGMLEDDAHESQQGKARQRFLHVLAKSLWRNSCRVETVINYVIGAALCSCFSSNVWHGVCYVTLCICLMCSWIFGFLWNIMWTPLWLFGAMWSIVETFAIPGLQFLGIVSVLLVGVQFLGSVSMFAGNMFRLNTRETLTKRQQEKRQPERNRARHDRIRKDIHFPQNRSKPIIRRDMKQRRLG